MRKRKDERPGMLPSRDGKSIRRTAHGTRFRRQQGKQKTTRAQKGVAGNSEAVAPSVNPQDMNLLARLCAVVGCQDLRLAGTRS